MDRKQISNEQLLCSEQSSSETGSPQLVPSSNSSSGAVQAFEALQAVLTTPSRTKYRHRMAEGYDLVGSPTFFVWQKLYRTTEEPVTPGEANPQGTTTACSTTATPSTSTTSTAGAPLNTMASLTSAAPSTGDSCQSHSTERVLREILTFPTLEASGPPKGKNIKRSIPNWLKKLRRSQGNNVINFSNLVSADMPRGSGRKGERPPQKAKAAVTHTNNGIDISVSTSRQQQQRETQAWQQPYEIWSKQWTQVNQETRL